MPDINKVADFFIATAQSVGDCITNLKLQKLAYYAEAWHLALYDRPLTGARFEAWVHGPVNPELYSRFRDYGAGPITEEAKLPKLQGQSHRHLNDVLDAYSRFSAWDLERMTHAEDPWLKARGAIPPSAPSNAAISPEGMRVYYRSRLKANG